jgi:transcriptional regulator with XRE-family HTH domain
MIPNQMQKNTSLKRTPLTLKKLRQARHITQEEIAKRLHTKQASIAKLEKRDNPRFHSIVRVIRAMGGKLVLKVSFRDGMKEELTFVGRTPSKAKPEKADAE